jgi:nucleotide-binding universal stress UspA family protein
MPIERILVAVDGSDHASRALDLAIEITRRFDAELVAIHVMTGRPLSAAELTLAGTEFQAQIVRDFDATRLVEACGDPQLMSQRLTDQALETASRFRWALGQKLTDDAVSRAREQGVARARGLLCDSDPAGAILAAAKDEAVDLLVMGRRGLGDLAGLLLGSVSHKVTQLAECACLTVK